MTATEKLTTTLPEITYVEFELLSRVSEARENLLQRLASSAKWLTEMGDSVEKGMSPYSIGSQALIEIPTMEAIYNTAVQAARIVLGSAYGEEGGRLLDATTQGANIWSIHGIVVERTATHTD